jgi:polyisoprenoid-binding protein YceI
MLQPLDRWWKTWMTIGRSEALAPYPHITFSSTRVERRDENRGRLHGELTTRDVTRPVELAWHEEDAKAEAKAEAESLRSS